MASNKPSNKTSSRRRVAPINDAGYEEITVAMVGNVDAGKCLAKDTLVMMHNGTNKRVQDIVVGDLLMGDDSRPRVVLSTTRGRDWLYNIIPVKGDTYTVNGKHILSLKASNWEIIHWDENRKRWFVRWLEIEKIKCKMFNPVALGLTKEETRIVAAKYLEETVPTFEGYLPKGSTIEISVEDYLTLSQAERNPYKGYRVGVDFPEKKIEMDPYILGYWLGDGTSSKTQITTADHEIVNIFTEYAENIGCRLRKTGGSDYSYDITTEESKRGGNIMRNQLREYDLFNNKHIPDVYLYNSRENRLKLLAGLIDSDGHLDKEKNCMEWTQKSETLFDQVLWLVRSLGFAAYKVHRYVDCVKPDGSRVKCEAYKMNIVGNLDDIPTQITRKQANERVTSKDWMVTGITVKKSHIGEYFGFELDGNGLFLLSDFTVTHNSSTIGTLITNVADNGNGSARSIVFTHPHEHETGRTSDISYQYLVDDESKRIISFVDLCGHEMYLKTTVSGLSSAYPDFAIVCISDHITQMTKEHINLCFAMNIPMILLFTKIDIVPPTLTTQLIRECKVKIKSLLKRVCFELRTVDDVKKLGAGISNVVPYLQVSNKTMNGIDILREVMRHYGKRPRKLITGFSVEHIYNVAGHGTVVSGMVGDKVSVGDTLYMGPFQQGNFVSVRVKSIHNDYRYDLTEIEPGKKGCLCISSNKKDKQKIRKGMVLTKEIPQNVGRNFLTRVLVHHHHTTIQPGFVAYVNVGMIRDTVRFVKMYDLGMNEIQGARSADQVYIEMRFLKNLNYVEPGQTIVFREGTLRGAGEVIKITDVQD